MLDIPTIETERLLLRPFCNDDLDEYAAMMADPDVVRYIGSGQPGDRNESWRSMAMVLGHWELRGYGLWAVEEKATRRLVGRIGLLRLEDWPGLEVGWLLAKHAWGKGYATEGAQVSLDYAFESVRAEHVISIIQVQNAASIRVAERIGEAFEEHRDFRGKAVAIYGMSRDTWTTRNASPT